MALLKASTRRELGSRRVRRLREKGLIPAIVYGHGEPAQAITLSEHELDLALQHGERLLEVDVDGSVQNVLIKEVQRDTFGQIILHVDLCRVSLDERVEVTVAITLRGTPAGEVDGGVIQPSVTEIHVECAVAAIPEDIRLLVNHLNVGDSIQLKDLELADDVNLLDDPEAVLCTCSVIVEEAEEATEPDSGEADVMVSGGSEAASST